MLVEKSMFEGRLLWEKLGLLKGANQKLGEYVKENHKIVRSASQ